MIFEATDGRPDAATEQLLDRLVVIARIPMRDYEVIVAESDLFEKLAPGDLAPEYTIIVHAAFNDRIGDYDLTFEAFKTSPGGLAGVRVKV